jgi:hypothetical protein
MDSRWLGLALAGGLLWAGFHGHPHAKIAGFIVGGLWLFAQAQGGGVLGQMNVQTKAPVTTYPGSTLPKTPDFTYSNGQPGYYLR